jgi:hypothetical protein
MDDSDRRKSMKPKRRGRLAAVCAGAAACLLLTVAANADLERVLAEGERRIQIAQEAQEQVDDIVNQTRTLVEEYRQVLREVESLEVYNTLMERMVARQEQRIAEIRGDMEQVTTVERQIVPLMDRMIRGLEEFVALDMPFLQQERTERVSGLWALLEREDVTVAEKFRRVMESYQIETDYGRNIEHYRGSAPINGVDREVDFLRVGRVTFVYQTPDGEQQGVWDQEAGEWVALGSDYRNRIRLAMRVARQQMAPELLLLPIKAPEDI